MKAIIDRLIIFCINLIMVLYLKSAEEVVIAIMVSFIIMGFAYYVKDAIAQSLIVTGAALITLMVPSLILFWPTLTYEAVEAFCEREHKSEKRRWDALFCYISVVAMAGVFVLKCWGEDWHYIFIEVVLVALAGWVCFARKEIDDSKRKLIVTRDSDEQLRLELENRNRILIQRQNDEVYMATLKERNRIAREIHDNVGHMLSRSLLQMGAVMTINKQENLKGPLGELRYTLDSAMTNIRSSVHDLHEESIDLEVSVKDAVKPLENRVRLVYDVVNSVDRMTKYTFVSIIKEAVSNIIKHSNATLVDVMLREHPGFYQLVIHDNGTNKEKCEPGIGLINMRDRVESVGGAFNVNVEKGFKIFITIPIKREGK